MAITYSARADDVATFADAAWDVGPIHLARTTLQIAEGSCIPIRGFELAPQENDLDATGFHGGGFREDYVGAIVDVRVTFEPDEAVRWLNGLPVSIALGPPPCGVFADWLEERCDPRCDVVRGLDGSDLLFALKFGVSHARFEQMLSDEKARGVEIRCHFADLMDLKAEALGYFARRTEV